MNIEKYQWSKFPMDREKFIGWIYTKNHTASESAKGDVVYNILTYLIDLYPEGNFYTNSKFIARSKTVKQILDDRGNSTIELMTIENMSKLEKGNIILNMDHESTESGNYEMFSSPIRSHRVKKDSAVVTNVNSNNFLNYSSKWPSHHYLQKLLKNKLHIILLGEIQSPICMTHCNLTIFPMYDESTAELLKRKYGLSFTLNPNLLLLLETLKLKPTFYHMSMDRFRSERI